MKFRNLITVVAFAVIFAFVFFFSALVFNKIFVQPNQIFILQGLSAFMGAFFAFLFIRLADFLSKIYERQVKHFNSLVTLEGLLTEIGGIIHDNIYLIPPFKKAITKGNIYWSTLRLLPIDKNYRTELYDIDLLNILFEFFYDVRKINDDIENISEGYDELKNAYIQKYITPENYVVNAEIIAGHLTIIEAFLKSFQKEIIKLIARIKIQIKRDIPLGTKIMWLFIRTSGGKITKTEIQKEVTKLNKEIEESRKKSREKIKKLLRKQRKIKKMIEKGGE